jgi:probable phosphoglycerate mutase
VIGLPNLYLVRHGETAWSLTGRHTGVTDLPLTVHGEEEARRLAPLFASIDVAQVFTSPRLRARQTCELVAAPGCGQVTPALTEWDYGEYEGLRTADIRSDRRDWLLWRDGCPGGESAAAVTQRADALIASLRALQGNNALFSHGQFGTVLALRWIGLPVVHGEHFPLSPASLSILGTAPGHPGVAAISLWNYTPAAA